MARLISHSIVLIGLVLIACEVPAGGPEVEAPGTVALVIHGGAGGMQRSTLSPERQAEYRHALETTLRAGYELLRAGSSSLDVVEATIRRMEDDPLFNAGRGAVFTAEGKNELDASIMDGASTLGGAVAGVTTVRHPISAARAVMERTEHVLLAGAGAEAFAEAEGLEIVDPKYFWTEARWESLQRAQERERAAQPGGAAAAFGTVGAVALDLDGRVAAGTSTGGMTNKRHGRIGDSPIIGAGTYASAGCGVSGTGHGEYFIRFAVAFDICSRHARGATIQEAADQVVHGVLAEAGGAGGIIALDGGGVPALVFNTEAMYRGHVLADGEPRVAIFNDE